jgi:hypothetical protein
LNNPNTEYLLSRQLRPDPLPARPASPPRTGRRATTEDTQDNTIAMLEVQVEHSIEDLDVVLGDQRGQDNRCYPCIGGVC